VLCYEWRAKRDRNLLLVSCLPSAFELKSLGIADKRDMVEKITTYRFSETKIRSNKYEWDRDSEPQSK
jgi:hypothetical protein